MGRRTAGHLTMTSGPRRMAVGRAVALRGSPRSSPGSLLRVTETRLRLTAPLASPMFPRQSPSGGMVDAADSKSVACKGVLVRVRPGAPFLLKPIGQAPGKHSLKLDRET